MRRSAEQQYSPWTGMTNFTQVHDPSSSALGAGLGGALSGAAVGQSLSGAFKDTPTDVPNVSGSVGDVNGQTIAPEEGASTYFDSKPKAQGDWDYMKMGPLSSGPRRMTS